jgi:hypothetical protein
VHRVTVAADDASFGKRNGEVQICIHIPFTKCTPESNQIIKMATTARLWMYVRVHNLFCTIQDAPWHELDNKSLLEVGVHATEFQHRPHSSQPFFRPLPLDQLHLLSSIRPKVNFEPWSGEDWSFGDHLIEVGRTLRRLFTEQLETCLEDDSLIETSVWQSQGQYVAVSPGVRIILLIIRSRFTPGQTKHLREYDTTFFRDPLPGQYEWHINDIYIAGDSPHMMAIHLDSHKKRGGLLRGELLSLLGIIRDRLKYPDIESHLIVPVKLAQRTRFLKLYN